eukprot:IDg10990t1
MSKNSLLLYRKKYEHYSAKLLAAQNIVDLRAVRAARKDMNSTQISTVLNRPLCEIAKCWQTMTVAQFSAQPVD